ncbi:MAG: hypothetical protein Q9160_006040 [Pyrenula sp. 1 TL-2023]
MGINGINGTNGANGIDDTNGIDNINPINSINGNKGNGAPNLINRAAESSSPYVSLQLPSYLILRIATHKLPGCHVMEHESFQSVEVAAILNSSFIPIKVDRESRHDIDEIYMHYVTATTGSGGWPLNVFLTPSLEPVFGGTYWPGPNNSNFPSRAGTNNEALTFLDILEKMRDVWQTQRQKCVTSATEITQQLKQFAEEGTHSQAARIHDDPSEPLDLDLIQDAFDHFNTRYDPKYGGFSTSSSAPKFPTAANLLFLSRIGGLPTSPFAFPEPVPSILGSVTTAKAFQMASHTLVQMSRGGIRDHLGYGFARYSVTPDWNLPHFEKMLPDNAQLLSAYSAAFASSHDPEHLGALYSLISYLTSSDSPLVSRSGALYSSEDADSPPTHSSSSEAEKREGAYYVFTHKEVHTILSDLPLPTQKSTTQYPQVPANAADILCRHLNILPDGNVPSALDPHDSFLSNNVLSIAATPSVLSREFGLPESSIVQILKAARKALASHRAATRIPPAVDTKIVTAYNALAITGLCDAAIALRSIDTDKSNSCITAASKIADFLHTYLYVPSTRTLYRVYTFPSSSCKSLSGDGGFDPTVPAFADDYAYLTRALLSLYNLTGSVRHLRLATDLQRTFNTLHASPTAQDHTGFYTTPSLPTIKSTSSAVDVEAAMIPSILRLKSGTDTSLPSPNGVAALNLLHLSNILSNTPLTSPERHRNEGLAADFALRAQFTLAAFAVEIIQHPFLFVTLIEAVVGKEVGFENITYNLGAGGRTTQAENVNVGLRLARWGRTLTAREDEMDVDVDVEERDLKGRKGIVKGKILWCSREGVCREVEVGEVEELDRTVSVPAVSEEG